MKPIKHSRRDFVKKTTLLTGAAMGAPLFHLKSHPVVDRKTTPGLYAFDKPVAIAMWDYSWLLRHYRSGSFEDWDQVLDGLVERGYNAIRMDCFPQFVAAGKDGQVQEEFFHIRETWKPAFWGNQFSMYSRPRDGLVEFIGKCMDRNIYLGLATWFMPHGTKRNLEFEGVSGLVRAWDETLAFLNENGLLKNVIYVDLLNEYPLWNGFEWFKKEMNIRGNEKLFKENNPDANVPDAAFVKRTNNGFTELQQEFYQSFINDVITALKQKWPDLTFFVSQTGGSNWKQMDHSRFGAIDPHFWFSQNKEFNNATGVGGLNMFRSPKDSHFRETYKNVLAYWKQNKSDLAGWMEQRIRDVAEQSRKFGIPAGNTEGWGAVFWQDHPLLDWEFIKEAAGVSVDLALKHGYKFICTSNFTHPQFKGIWEDGTWHQQLTSRIRGI